MLYLFYPSEKSAECHLREKFSSLKLSMDAFCKICYVGVKTMSPPTDFSKLKDSIEEQLNDTSVRSPRKPDIIFQSLKVSQSQQKALFFYTLI